jgi:hypothetical protein
MKRYITFKYMRHIIQFALIAVLFCSCALLGTRTIYKAREHVNIQKVGIIRPDQDSLFARIFPQTAMVIDSTINEVLKNYGIYKPEFIYVNLSFKQPDPARVKELCSRYELDALILTKIRFMVTPFSAINPPVFETAETKVEMQLLAKSGELICHTKHNTDYGNESLFPLSVNSAIYHGTKGALKRIIKEMNLHKAKRRRL